MKVVAVIPAHLASVRFPNKILLELNGIPMIEHVRKRAVLSGAFSEVYVATCDLEVAAAIEQAGGKVIMTRDDHKNGTTRAAEAVTNINCTHVVLIQGDEPLILPDQLTTFTSTINAKPEVDCWNLTSPVSELLELDDRSTVKCAVAEDGRIVYCFRRSPSHAPLANQLTYMRKIQGLVGFRKASLLSVSAMPPSIIEESEFIEQMRIVDAGNLSFYSVASQTSLPSINVVGDDAIVIDMLKNDSEQLEIQARYLTI
jgi:3-deoxy-manno-octulosonate cytidylyltransferase (CMP-KDO synthetase)